MGVVTATGVLQANVLPAEAWEPLMAVHTVSGFAASGFLAAATITGLRDYPLTARPDTGSFEIYVDGELWTDGYTYDPSTNTISLDAELEGGEFIEILYDSYAACD